MSTCSSSGGSSGATCSFVRRSTNGRIRCRRRASRSARCAAFASGALPAPTPSVYPARRPSIGRTNSSRNRRTEGNSPGTVSASRACSSVSEFSSGVPVTAIVRRTRRSRTTWCVRAAAFFTACASSSSTRRERAVRREPAERRRVEPEARVGRDRRGPRRPRGPRSAPSAPSASIDAAHDEARHEPGRLRHPVRGDGGGRHDEDRAPLLRRQRLAHVLREREAHAASCRAPCRRRAPRRAHAARGIRATRTPAAGTAAARRAGRPGGGPASAARRSRRGAAATRRPRPPSRRGPRSRPTARPGRAGSRTRRPTRGSRPPPPRGRRARGGAGARATRKVPSTSFSRRLPPAIAENSGPNGMSRPSTVTVTPRSNQSIRSAGATVTSMTGSPSTTTGGGAPTCSTTTSGDRGERGHRRRRRSRAPPPR